MIVVLSSNASGDLSIRERSRPAGLRHPGRDAAYTLVDADFTAPTIRQDGQVWVDYGQS